MNTGFTTEQEELRAMVRDFLSDRSPESEVRRLMDTAQGFDPTVWKQLGEDLGVLGLTVPEEYGGGGHGFAELAVVLEEAGRALLCAPLLSSAVLAVHALLLCADDAAKHDYLPGLANGELRGTLALSEDSGSWLPAAVTLTAARSGDGWVLDGHKSYVIDGHTADLILVVGQTEAGISLFAVEADAPGLSAAPLVTMDMTRKQARLEFESVPARLLGVDGEAAAGLERVLDLAAIAVAMEQVGGAGRVLEMSVEYAKVRYQFGRAIGSFQAIKHKCADMLVAVEGARSAAYHAAWSAAADEPGTPAAANVAKSFCSEAYLACSETTIQIHGGIGFTWEHPAHLYLRRAKSTSLLFGDASYHRELLATRIGI